MNAEVVVPGAAPELFLAAQMASPVVRRLPFGQAVVYSNRCPTKAPGQPEVPVAEAPVAPGDGLADQDLTPDQARTHDQAPTPEAEQILEAGLTSETTPTPGAGPPELGPALAPDSSGKDGSAPNEDSAAVIPLGHDLAVLVVADGMGGGPAGEKASALAVQSLVASLARIDPTQDQQLRFGILNGIEEANRAIQQLGVGAATTLAVVELRGRIARPYHVGDCLILVVGQRGRIKLQSVPHSPVGYGVESGLLDDLEAMHHDERHLVSNLVGTPEMRIEVGAPLPLALRDTLVVASDGLSDNLYVDEIADLVRKGSLPKAAGQLAQEARHRMQVQREGLPSKPDDLTFIAFRPASRQSRPDAS